MHKGGDGSMESQIGAAKLTLFFCVPFVLFLLIPHPVHAGGSQGSDKSRHKRCRILVTSLPRSFQGALKHLVPSNRTAPSYKRRLCSIANAKSVRHLAKIIRRPYKTVFKQYKAAKRYLRDAGGIHGLQTSLKLLVRLRNQAMQAGFPKWPLKISYNKTLKLFSSLVHDFGPDFPTKLVLGRYKYKNVTNVQVLVHHLVEATDLDDFFNRMQYDRKSASPLIRRFTAVMNKNHWKSARQQLRHTIRFLRILKRLKLLDLPP